MFNPEEKDRISEQAPLQTTEAIFNDPEAKSNLVGLYNLALKIAKRNPELWAKISKGNND